jgi:Glycosyl hydrolase family 20, domain 2/Glycosyl hydrolase family 20, catalytic domain
MSRRTWLLGNAAGLGSMATTMRGMSQTSLGARPSTEEHSLFPWPQSVEFGSRRISLIRGSELQVSIEADKSTGAAGLTAAKMVAAEFKRRTGRQVEVRTSGTTESGFKVQVSSFEPGASGNETEVEGGYRLRVTTQGAFIQGKGIGLSHAAATFNQLLQGWRDLHLTEVEIKDWPEVEWRGIFAEVGCVAGMNLQDWRELIDLASRLKLNAINVGLYNCWQLPHLLGVNVEFFLFPSRQYPQFRTPLKASYYSYKDNRQIEVNELPPIYREDFLGQVVSYGKDKGIEVSPYFTSLSHNTLIPRLMPEISMKDSQCRPIGYGFCTTCPKTYDVLFALYDEIIDRYARPYGITTFHVGMDETRHVCQCPDCKVAWNGVNNFYVDHLIKIVQRLKSRGMKRVLVWHDMLHRLGLINEDLQARFKAAGIEDLITLCWWYYNAPKSGDSLYAPDSFGKAFFRPNSGLNAWTTPSAGWDTLRPLGASFQTENIALYDLLREGGSRGAKGTISYSTHDPLFFQGYVNFAQYSWNLSPSVAQTRSRFGRWLSSGDGSQCNEALRLYEDAYASYRSLVDTYYSWTYLPSFGHAAASIGVTASRESTFQNAIENLQNATRILSDIHDHAEDPEKAKLLAGYLSEVSRLQAFVRAAYAILKCTHAYDDFRDKRDHSNLEKFGDAVEYLRTSVLEHAAALRGLEETRYWPSRIRFMVYETRAHKDMEKFEQIFSKLLERARQGDTQYLPEVSVAANDFVGADLGMTLPEKA